MSIAKIVVVGGKSQILIVGKLNAGIGWIEFHSFARFDFVRAIEAFESIVVISCVWMNSSTQSSY